MPSREEPQQIWIRRRMGGYDIRLDGGRDAIEGWISVRGTQYSVQMKGLPSENLYISDAAVVKEMPGEEPNTLWQTNRISTTRVRLGKEGEGWAFASNGRIATNLKVQCHREPELGLVFELRAAYFKECLSRTYLRNLVRCYEFVGLLHAGDHGEHLPALLYAIDFEAYGEARSW